MGNTALLATMAAALVASVALVNADFSVLSTADSQTRDEQNVLAERAATSAFEMAASQLRRDFGTWRTGYPATSYLGGTFVADVGGPATGPVRIQARGVNADTVSVAIVGWMSRLAAASGALTIDADTASVYLRGANVVVSGVDHRATSWKAGDMREGNGMAEPVIGLLASQTGSHYAVGQALGTGSSAARVRGVNGDGDIAQGGLPTDFATLLGEAVGNRTRTIAGGALVNTVYGTPAQPAVVHVTDDVSFAGGGGYGLLYVEGSFEASGDFAWEGLVIADGENQMDFALSGNATIRGAAYVTHTSTTSNTVTIGNTETPVYTLWSPDDERGTLRAYTFGPDGTGDRSEGDLVGWATPGPQNGDFSDSEALAFGPDGTLYIVNNPYRSDATGQVSRLYKIEPDQLDGDASTPVHVTEIGRTRRDRTNDDEVHGMVFYQGRLYGIGESNRTIYDLSLTSGRANEINTFAAIRDNQCRGNGDRNRFRAKSISADGNNNVYITRACDGQAKTQIYKFTSFPDGRPEEVATVPATLSGIGFHPDGYAYGYDAGAGTVYRIDVEQGTSTALSIPAVSGDIEDMALYFAGEMTAMGLDESPRLDEYQDYSGHGLDTQRISWPGLGTVDINAKLSHAWRGGGYNYSLLDGNNINDFLSNAVYHNGNSFNLSGHDVDRGANVEYTGPMGFPTLSFMPSVGAQKETEYIEIVFNDVLSMPVMFAYVADIDWSDVVIQAWDRNGTPISTSAWTKSASVDVVGSDDGKRTTMATSGSTATLTPNNRGFDGETIIDEVRIPDAPSIGAIRFTTSTHGQRGDYLAFGIAERSVFEETGALTVDLRDNASIRYSAEAIGKLAVRLPTIASASWFETFDRFAKAEVDRMFGLERRVMRGANLRPAPVHTDSLPPIHGDTGSGGSGSGGSGGSGSGGSGSGGIGAGAGAGGGILPDDTSGSLQVYVCHADGLATETLRISPLSLATHLGHGDAGGQCPDRAGGYGAGSH